MKSKDQPPSILQRIGAALISFIPARRAASREDVLERLQQAEEDGIVERDSYDMIQRILYVSDMRVRDVMIPRTSMEIIERDATLDSCLDVMVESGHSRFPVIDNEKDQFVGILLAKDLLKFFDEDNKQRFTMRDLIRPAVFVPESKRLNVLLSEFRTYRNHMALVADEFGAVAGVVTIEDVLEQIVGDIEDEHDVDEEEDFIRTLSNGETLVKALLPIDEFNDHFKTYFSESGSDTIGGLISQTAGHIPQPGEGIEIENVKFEIIHADSRRIHIVRVIKLTNDIEN
ncbi:HlyC/CorC family transporter [Arenicella sp. 4NH20-0111]|uniref:HlyC/CorC family transporter n=1 Tax=Arenicella sp. 4NH20-0111 TaxID=3127648 RepID=UPI003104A5C4